VCSYAAKLVIIASNCPAVRKSEIEYYVMLSKTGLYHYTGSAPLFFLLAGGFACFHGTGAALKALSPAFIQQTSYAHTRFSQCRSFD
jgi:hypothetical protein